MADPVPTPAAAPEVPAEPDKTVLSDALPAGRVPVARPDGTLTSVRADRYEEALGAGYKFQTPEQQASFREQLKYGDRPVAAAAAAAGRGATLGLSDVVLPATGLVQKETLAGLEHQNPGVSTAGELAGAIAPALIPGVGEASGPGLAMKLGRAAEGVTGLAKATSLGGRLAAGAVRGAAEGSLFGAGNALSEAALGDPDMTADKVLAHVGLGALLGAGGAGMGTAIEEGVAGLIPKLSRAAPKAQSALEDFADDRWLKAAGGIQSSIKKIPAAEHGAVADVVRAHLSEPGAVLPRSLDDALASLEGERGAVGANVIKEAGITDAGGLAPHLDRDEAVAAIERATSAHGKRMGAVMDAADQLGAKPSYSQVLSRLDSFESGLNPAERDLAEKPLSDLRRYLDEMGSKPVGSKQNSFAALNELKSTITKGINYKTEDNVAIGLKKQLAGILRDEIDTQLAPQIGPDLSKEWLAAKGEFGALSRADEALGRKASTGLDAIRALGENATTAPPSLGRLSALEHARNLLQHGIERKGGNRWLSASDYLTGIGAGVMHGGPMGALTGLASSVAHKFMREHGPGVVAKLADRLAASPALSALSKSFGAQLSTLAPKLGDYAPVLLNAAARSPQAALATHMTLAKVDPQYADTARLAGLAPESPEEHDAAISRAHRVSEVGAAAAEADKAIDRTVEKLIKGTAAPTGTKALKKQDFGNQRMRRDNEAAHEQRVNEYRALSDPDKLLEHIAPNLEGVSPAIAAAMTARAATAVQYVTQAAAVPPKAGPLAHEWAPPEADMHDFALKLEAVERPLEALGHPAVTEEQVEAIKAVYPKLAQEVADRMLLRLSESPEVPYSARLVVNLLTGVDPDGTFSAESIAANQGAIASSGGSKAAPAGQGSPRKRSGSITLAARTAPRSERLEE